MHLPYIAGLLLVGVIVSCRKEQESACEDDAEIEWITATKSLDEYAAETSGQPIVALCTMEWDLLGKLFKKHIEANQGTLFPENMPKFLEYDCSEDGSRGREMLTKAGVVYMPVIFVSYGGKWQYTALPNDFLQDPNTEDDYLGELRRIISAAKK